MSSVNEREISQDHVYSLKTYETLFTLVFGFPGKPNTLLFATPYQE